MSKKINRRMFIKRGIAASAATLLSTPLLLEASTKPDIAVATGPDSFKNTKKAVERLGGMKRFVAKNARVAVLANAQRNNPGSYTHTELIRAVIRMCKEAGASEILFLTQLPETNWESTGQKAVIEGEGARLVLVGKEDDNFRSMPIEKGLAIKEARIMEEFFKYDTFINMPITKDHAGNKFTGTLKNLMGLNAQSHNRANFHKPNWTTDPEAILHLDQCIADLNLVFRNHLCVVDATEFITTNGPMGPGKLLAPQKVVVGTDRVALDAYCCTLWGLDPQKIQTIVKASAHGLGQINPRKIKIKEYRV